VPNGYDPRMSDTFVLDTPLGNRIHGLIDVADLPGRRPTVVICHGFKGFQEWGFFPHLATLLAERGFTVIRFNFPGSGMLPGDDLVTNPEAFRTATLSGELDDLSWLLNRLDDLAPERVDTERLGLIGHSRGGGTSILASALPELRHRLRALVTWSAVSTFDRMTPAEEEAWRAAGSVPVTNARTGQQLELGCEVLDDLKANAARLDIGAAAAARCAPWLIIHGDRDETVPASEAAQLASQAQSPCELLHVEASGHTFEVGHPFKGPSPQLITALNATQTWLRRYLRATDFG
jgi:pimeloyl-ACP methyl ester carboxylesterase